MDDLETAIRARLGDFVENALDPQAAAAACLAALDLHKSGDEDHLCIKEIVGYSVQDWYADGEDCPTVVAIAKGLGLLNDEEGET